MRANVLRMYCAAAVGSGLPPGPSGVHVNQPHVVGAERSLELTVSVVAFVPEPLGLGPPVRLVSFPDVQGGRSRTRRS